MGTGLDSVFSGRVVELIQSIRWQFSEDPELRLSPSDAARVWHMDQARMEILFETLVEVGFLARTRDGRYYRRPDLDDLALEQAT